MIEIQILFKIIYNEKTNVTLSMVPYKPPVTLILDSLDNIEYYRKKELEISKHILSNENNKLEDIKVEFTYKDLSEREFDPEEQSKEKENDQTETDNQ